jgi:uncharacterized membrane protein (UPF0182 family)
LRSQADVRALSADVDPFDQQLDDPCLFGWEQLVPEGIKSVQCVAHVGFA